MKKAFITLTLAAATVLGQGFGPGGPGMGRGIGPGMGMGPGADQGVPGAAFTELTAYLGLTDSQVTQLRELRTQQSTAARPILTQIQERRQALQTALKSETVSASELGQILLDVRNLEKQLTALRPDFEKKAQAILTPAQAAKLPALVEAQKLAPVIGQATATGLLSPPAGAIGARMMGARAGWGAVGAARGRTGQAIRMNRTRPRAAAPVQ